MTIILLISLYITMDQNLIYKNNCLFLDGLSFKEIYEEFGSPCYIYSEKTILNNVALAPAPNSKAFNAVPFPTSPL